MEKILRTFSPSFDFIVTNIEENRDLRTMTIEKLMGSLQAYEEKPKRKIKQKEDMDQLLQLNVKETNYPNYNSQRGRGRGRDRGCGRGHGGEGKGCYNNYFNNGEKRNNLSMSEEFKKDISNEFEMTDMGIMAYYLGIEVKQEDRGIFITQEGYAKEVLKKFKMDDTNLVGTPMECGSKLSKHENGEIMDPTLYKSLVGSLRYLTSTRPNILYVVGFVSRYMEAPTTTHFKAEKRIIRYIKGITNFDLHYYSYNNYEIIDYSDSDWSGDLDDRKSTTGFMFFMGDTTFTWMSNKQSIVTLSTCEAEYNVATSCVYHAIYLRNLLKELKMPQEDHVEICVDNKSTLPLAKNPVFHERSKHIDTRYHS
ncbi:uncharacterized mitochondrial protein AtMg00810-like [Lathyrus oleraceus]|uniref:uncharacterized mitochondrial protein AtMg00810-like n=1 Tax=Pisum sativum TaxID=3888 RepID=UPI0021D3B3FE|nr:uncharacterized mitochondrial protein AtMg00810-like [Pisum sativum]